MSQSKFQAWKGTMLADIDIDPCDGVRLVLPDGSWIELHCLKSTGEVTLSSSGQLSIHVVAGNAMRVSTAH